MPSDKILIVALRRQNGEMLKNPPHDTTLEAGDDLIVLGHTDQLPSFTAKTTSEHRNSHPLKRWRLRR